VICVDLAAVAVAQPDKVLFNDLAVTVSTGDRVAVVGVNGSGKTTLLKIMTGVLTPDEGDVRFGRGVRIASLEQDPVLPAGTVREFLGDSWEVAAVATKLGVQPLFDRRTDELSGGQAKRVALAKVLADDEHGDHDLVVLDEPTNHLDLEAIEWLESRLVKMKSALVLVTHDRHALDRLTTDVGPSKVVELDGGRCFVHQAAAGSSAYATYLDARAERIDREVQEESTRKILARKELAWLRRGAPARSTKPKARLRSANEIVSGGPAPVGVRGSELQLGGGTARLGNQVVELEDVAQRFELLHQGSDPRCNNYDSVEPIDAAAHAQPSVTPAYTLPHRQPSVRVSRVNDENVVSAPQKPTPSTVRALGERSDATNAPRSPAPIELTQSRATQEHAYCPTRWRSTAPKPAATTNSAGVMSLDDLRRSQSRRRRLPA
jgi:ATP-binding cassette subfamily F protein uup